jgi:xylulokinase
VILTLDLGTSSTKATIWAGSGSVSQGRGPVPTTCPRPGWAEQEPSDWWQSVIVACQQLDSDALAAVDGVGFSAARETFALVGGDGEPLGPGILWSDRRAGSTLGRLTWVSLHQPERFAAARWVMAPRDLIVFRLTGRPATDRTVAARAGLTDLAGSPVDLAAPLLPPVFAPAGVVGRAEAGPAAAIGIRPGTPVAVGAGDRACEVLGTGVGPGCAMISWGTTANASLPVASFPDPVPGGGRVSPGALGGWLVEYGLSSAGGAIDWLGQLTGRTSVELTEAMAEVSPGAGGVVAVPWLNGARAPWWQPAAVAAFFHLTPAHGPQHLTRALYEGVAFDVARSLEASAGADRIGAAGRGAATPAWIRMLAAVTGCAVERRRVAADAASAGACLLVDPALALDDINPVVEIVEPDEGLVACYRPARDRSDEACRAVLRLS